MLAELCPLPSSPTQIQKVLFLHLITDKRRRYGSRPSMELIDDLVVEILLRLPAKFVARFRCVSKRWLSISSDPKFIRSHRLRHHSLSGFFLSTAIRKTTYFPIDSSSPPPPPVLYPTVSLPGIAGGLDWTLIDGCCNDFIIYRSRERLLRSADIFAYPLEYRPVIHLYNLKTLEHTRLLAPEKLNGYSQIVIFDPSRFPGEYKLISSGVRMHLFSSKNRSWKVLFDRSPMPKVRSVYWEGSLVWLNEKLTRLDVQGECVSTMPWPGTGMISCHYLGESRGWLHFIGSSSPENILDSMCFDIFAIQSMDSGWSVLHRVDIGAIKDVYPEVIPPTEGEGEGQHSNPYPRLAISVVYFHRGIGGKGRGDQLLLSIPRKIVSYNLQDKNFMTVTDNVVGRNEGVEALSSKTEYRWWHFFPLPPALSTL